MARIYGQRDDGHRDFVLTFDDGPVAKTTGPLLDILAKHDIRAMFFAVGSLLATTEGKAIARRAQDEGHVIGNHTFSHPNLRGLSKDKVRDELQRTHRLICECSGSCKYFRPPFGSSSAIVSDVLQELGYTPVLWNVDTLDWKLKKNGAWVEHAMEQIKVREDSIVLMHDIHKSTIDHGIGGNETDAGLKKIRTKLGEADAKAAGRERWKTDRAFGKRILDLCWASGKSHSEELHGTYDYRNMGRDVSHECVRHYNEDIVTIFNAVSVGDYVAIVKSIDDPMLRAQSR